MKDVTKNLDLHECWHLAFSL